MHYQAFNYVEEQVKRFPPTAKTVVELGSYIVNGSVRGLFHDAASYVGVDVRGGDGVDVVSDARSYQPAEPVDMVISTEMLEHCPQAEKVINNVYAMLKPGGVFILTAAGLGRAPHSNDGHAAVGREYYANVDEADLYEWFSKAKFKAFEISTNPAAGDIYAYAVK